MFATNLADEHFYIFRVNQLLQDFHVCTIIVLHENLVFIKFCVIVAL